MPNPATHLVYGYLISKNLTDKKKFIIIGLLSSILVDIDGLHIPGIQHHGLTHTPFFILIISIIVLAVTGSKLFFKLFMFNMLVHIGLDTISTTIPIMWFYPLSTFGFAVGMYIPISLLFAIKISLFVIPVYYLIKQYKADEINPIELYEYLKRKIGTVQTYAMITFFSGLTIYIWIVDYVMELI